MPQANLANWAGNVTFRAAQIHAPTSIDELRRTVAGADRIRAVGSGHSFSRVADTTGDLVTLAGLPGEVEVDGAGGQVLVGGGVTFAALFAPLRAAGVALADLASLPHISVAGSVATGTHGSGRRRGGLASQVVALERVTAEGDLEWVRRGEPGFDGSVVALGALGIVTRVVLTTEPEFEVTQTVHLDLDLARIAADVDAVFACGYSVSVFTDFAGGTGNRARAYVKRRTDETYPDLTEGVPATGPEHPIPGAPAESCTRQLGVPGPWCERLPHFRPEFVPSAGDELQSEFFVPRALASPALEALMELGAMIAPAIHVAELRSVAAEQQWLSPAYGRDTLTIHFTWYHDEQLVAPVLRAVEKALAPYDPRPHWGKVTSRPAAELGATYPRLADAARLRAEIDPRGTFGNDLVDALLGPAPRTTSPR